MKLWLFSEKLLLAMKAECEAEKQSDVKSVALSNDADQVIAEIGEELAARRELVAEAERGVA